MQDAMRPSDPRRIQAARAMPVASSLFSFATGEVENREPAEVLLHLDHGIIADELYFLKTPPFTLFFPSVRLPVLHVPNQPSWIAQPV